MAINIAYAADTQPACTLGSLAGSSTFIAGREAAFLDNTSNLYDDILLSGTIKAGTTPTAGQVALVYVFTPVNDTPTWPDQMTGTDAARNLTSANNGSGFLKLAAVITMTATSNEVYSFGQISIAQLFGGILPPRVGIFVTHNNTNALNASGHEISAQGITYTVT